MRILVVDDNIDAAESLRDLLELRGHRVLTAARGEEAIEKAGLFCPQAIFMDIGLPGIDGTEAARRIRALPELQDVAIIALTGWGQSIDRARTAAAGMAEHLTKPVTIEFLARALVKIPAMRIKGQDGGR